MGEFRQIKNNIAKYEELLDDSSNFKENIEEVLEHLEIMQAVLESYIKKYNEIFQKLHNYNMKIFFQTERNLFHKKIRSIEVDIINLFISKYNLKIQETEDEKIKLMQIKCKLKRMKYFL